MTDPMMHLRSLVEQTPDADILRDMISFAAERLMELEVGGLTGAAYGEKSPIRLVQRNGHRERDWQTRAGKVELHIPKLHHVLGHHLGQELNFIPIVPPDADQTRLTHHTKSI